MRVASLEARQVLHHVDGSTVVVRTSGALIDGVLVELSPRECEVVSLLLRRPGTVVPKRELLEEVWHGAADLHAVEAAINRLRRRLTGTAIQVDTVPKRGYRLIRGAPS